MAEVSIPVDLLNPGQVFACIGFAEAADVLLGDAECCFDWSSSSTVLFHLRAGGEEDPIRHVLRFLSQATVVAEAPSGSVNIAGWKQSWGDIPRELPAGAPYPSSDPDSPATLVAALITSENRLCIDYWADMDPGRDVKFWAGSAGYPGAALIRDALDLVRDTAIAVANDPFSFAVPQSSSFRLDWRRDYIPIDAGFSLNSHDNIKSVGYPLVELLGAVGLTHARPRMIGTKYDLHYRYGVIGTSRDLVWLPLQFLRAALGETATPFETRHFHMYLNWPGKPGQARAITQVIEESE